MRTDFSSQKHRKRKELGRVGDERMILKWTARFTSVDDINLVQDVDQWRVNLKTVMDLPFTYTARCVIS
jgi:hypothetical protein